METLCGLFGYTRQAYYQNMDSKETKSLEEEIIVEMVNRKRRQLKNQRIGGRKLHYMLEPDFLRLGIHVGRDNFFDILRRNSLLVRRRRRKAITTYSYHRFHRYPNLVKGIEISGPNQVWVSDITYVDTDQGFLYLFLITDAYSRKIIGYYVSENLKTDGALKALNMAIKKSPYPLTGLIHHSDRGIQYCSNEYVKTLTDNNIVISMTENGDPYENAIAERVNGILKDEWLNHQRFHTMIEAKAYIADIIRIYNSKRPHSSCNMLTPDKAHQTVGTLQKWWKNYPYRRSIESLNF